VFLHWRELLDIIIIKKKVLLPHAVILTGVPYSSVSPLDFLLPKMPTWWRFFQKRVVCAKLYSYALICNLFIMLSCVMQTIMQYSITYPTHPQDILTLNKIVSRMKVWNIREKEINVQYRIITSSGFKYKVKYNIKPRNQNNLWCSKIMWFLLKLQMQLIFSLLRKLFIFSLSPTIFIRYRNGL
jgi:hypothetical protein